MNTRMRLLIGAVLLPLVATTGVLCIIAARHIGGATPPVALLGSFGIVLYLVAMITGAALFGRTA